MKPNRHHPFTVSSMIPALCILLMAVIFAIDLQIPLGVAGGVPYSGVVVLGWWLPHRKHLTAIAILCSLLTVAGYYLSPDGGIHWMVLTNRFLAIFSIWVTFTLVVIAKEHDLAKNEALLRLEAETVERKRAQEELQQANAALEERVRQRWQELQYQISIKQSVEVELQNSQNLFQTVIETIPTGIFVKDLHSRFVTINSHDPLASQGKEHVIGKTVGELGVFDADYIARSLEEDARVLNEGESIVTTIKGFRSPEGKTCHYRVTKAPLKDGAGRMIGLVGVREDISSHILLEAELRESQKMEALGHLAGGIAHDFNNILQIIFNYSEFALSSTSDPGKLSHSLRAIQEAAEKAAHLTRQLLTFGRKKEMRLAPVDLSLLTGAIANLVGRLIGEDIELTTIRPETPVWANADPVMLEQVLINLCINARDAMQGNGKLEIGLDMATPPLHLKENHGLAQAPHARLWVQDNGMGIKTEILEHIFEPFYTTKEVGKGTGLGLATAHGIILDHHGAITVQSPPGEGALFQIYLPQIEAPQAAPPPAVQSSQPAREGGKTILLAEDDQAMRDLLTGVLQENGYCVLAAGDGEEALQFFDSEMGSIDMVILDVIMPKVQGGEVYTHIRNHRSELPILISTGCAYSRLESELGPIDTPYLLMKPFSMADLVEKVDTLIQQPSG